MAYNDSSASRASVGAILKPIFDKQARSILSEEFNFWKYVQNPDGEKVKLDGEDFVIEVQTERNDRSQNFAEEGDLPFSGVPVFKQGKIRAVRFAQPIQVTHELKMLADRDVATFCTRLEALYSDAKAALARTMNKQAVSDGTGILTTATGSISTGAATGTLAVADSSVFEENQSLEIFDTTLATKRPASATSNIYVVVSIDTATQITLAATDGANLTAGTVNTDKIFRAGSMSAAGGAYQGMNGLQQITSSTASFMNITAAKWLATRVDAAGAAVGPRLLGRAQIAMRRRSNSAGKLNTIWMSPEQTLDVVYGQNGTFPDVRFSREDASKVSVKGANAPAFNFGGQDITVQTDLDMPLTKAIMFKGDSLLVGSLHDVKMEEFGDGLTALPVFNKTTGAYKAADISWLTWRGNMGCYARNEFVEVYGLPTPA
jgi:hypothetical protein